MNDENGIEAEIEWRHDKDWLRVNNLEAGQGYYIVVAGANPSGDGALSTGKVTKLIHGGSGYNYPLKRTATNTAILKPNNGGTHYIEVSATRASEEHWEFEAIGGYRVFIKEISDREYECFDAGIHQTYCATNIGR